MTEGPTRIVQLSDLHLTAADDQRRSEPRLFGRLRGMNGAFRRILAAPLLQRADALLVTGDITDDGSLEAWEVFWGALKAAEIPRERVLLVPGNHDVCCLGVRPPRADNIKEDLARLERGMSLPRRAPSLPWAQMVGEDVVVFGLDSSNPGNLSAITNAVGELGFFQLQAFARLLKRHEDVPVKLVALHHSPNIPGAEAEEERGLDPTGVISRLAHEIPERDRRALRLLCVAHGVRLIIHGHLHRAEDRRVNGIRLVGAPASTQPLPREDGAVERAGGPTYALYCYTVSKHQRVSVKLHELTP